MAPVAIHRSSPPVLLRNPVLQGAIIMHRLMLMFHAGFEGHSYRATWFKYHFSPLQDATFA
jgi:hypothetical protein